MFRLIAFIAHTLLAPLRHQPFSGKPREEKLRKENFSRHFSIMKLGLVVIPPLLFLYYTTMCPNILLLFPHTKIEIIKIHPRRRFPHNKKRASPFPTQEEKKNRISFKRRKHETIWRKEKLASRPSDRMWENRFHSFLLWLCRFKRPLYVLFLSMAHLTTTTTTTVSDEIFSASFAVKFRRRQHLFFFVAFLGFAFQFPFAPGIVCCFRVGERVFWERFWVRLQSI